MGGHKGMIRTVCEGRVLRTPKVVGVIQRGTRGFAWKYFAESQTFGSVRGERRKRGNGNGGSWMTLKRSSKFGHGSSDHGRKSQILTNSSRRIGESVVWFECSTVAWENKKNIPHVSRMAEGGWWPDCGRQRSDPLGANWVLLPQVQIHPPSSLPPPRVCLGVPHLPTSTLFSVVTFFY